MLSLLACGLAQAHPVSQGSMEISLFPDHIEWQARVSTEEVFVRQAFAASSGNVAAAADLSQAWREHGQYLSQHVRILADGHPLKPALTGVTPPPEGAAAGAPGQAADRLVCSFACQLAPDAPPPVDVRVEEDVLNEIAYAPGNRWEASYVVRVVQAGHAASEGHLLTSRDPLLYRCDWPGAADGSATVSTSPDAPGELDHRRLVREYIHHGIMHILTGYDHLLFISALALAAVTFWDLVKVIGTFTLAHTVTLTLATLNIVRLPSHIVEPMISASIVFVALQNVFFPGRTRGSGRLLVAFFFGLFHGLGFAGGLLEAMASLPPVAITLALAAFSLGVELGHQVVVLPLFFGLKWLRFAQADTLARFRVTGLTLRGGSALIALAGSYYLVVALRG